MSEPATPPQLAANNMAATEAVDQKHSDPLPPSTRDLVALNALVCEARDRIDVGGASAEGTALLASWHDTLGELSDDIARMLLKRSYDAVQGQSLLGSLRSSFRDLAEGTGLRALVADGTRLLDLLADTIGAIANPDDRARLNVWRSKVVRIVNEAQDRIDT